MSKNYVVGYDVSTSGTKCMAVDMEGNIIGVSEASHFRIPGLLSGESRFRPEALMTSAKQASEDLRKNYSLDPEDCLGVGAGGAMHGLCIINGLDTCDEDIVFWDDQGDEEEAVFLSSRWEIPIAKRFTAARYLGWKKRNKNKVSDVRHIMTPASLLTFMGTGHSVTLPGDASGMLGYLENPYQFEEKKVEYIFKSFFHKSRFRMLPEIKKFGEQIPKKFQYEDFLGWGARTNWVAPCGDQPLGSLGKGCSSPGDISIELGSSIVLNAFGFPVIKDQRGLIEALRSSLGEDMSMSCVTNGTQSYDIFANSAKNITGYSGDKLYQHLSKIAGEIPAGSEGLMAFPFYRPEHSLGHNNSKAFSSVIGLNKSNQSLAHQARAHMEAPIYILKKAWGKIIRGRSINKVIISGGGSKSDTWCQIVSDMLGQKVVRTQTKDSVAFGAALNALYMASDSRQNVSEFLSERVKLGKEFFPNLSNTQTYFHLMDYYFHTERKIYG